MHHLFELGQKTFLGDEHWEYFVVPKEAPIYHGSHDKRMPTNNVPFPVGLSHYDPLSTAKTVDMAYFSTIEVATDYAGPNGVILAFRTKRPLILFQVTPGNLARLESNSNMPDDVKESVAKLFSWHPERPNELIRPKTKKTDRTWAEWIRKVVPSVVAGIFVAQLWRTSERLASSQDEFILFNATTDLERCLTDPHDWQHVPFKHVPLALTQLESTMRHYVTQNVAVHSGDLWEHSVWSCLWAERLTTILFDYGDPDVFSEKEEKQLSAMALIHDIGKCNPSACQHRGTFFTYFAQQQHPEVGSQYISGDLAFPSEEPFLPQLMSYLGLETRETAFIVKHHWELGPLLRKWVLADKSPSVAASFRQVFPQGTPTRWLKKLFLVSSADMLATQPPDPGVCKKNIASRFWPLANVPRKHKGTFLFAQRIGFHNLEDLKRFFRQVFPVPMDVVVTL